MIVQTVNHNTYDLFYSRQVQYREIQEQTDRLNRHVL